MLLGSAVSVALLVSSCADLPDTHSGDWQEKPAFQPAERPPGGMPSVPGDDTPPGPRTPVPPPQGCKDFDPLVIATCLNQVTAVVALADGAALAAERGGRILRVRQERDPVVVATVPVDAAAGGLSGLALSPSFAQDGLLYAYATTGRDSQVLRVAHGEAPKPILTGIPRLPGGDNRGGLTMDPASGNLLVATAGTPVSAADPASLSGKILRIDTSGAAAADNPGGQRAVAAGLTSPGGICIAPETGAIWVTDSTADQDLLYRVEVGKPLPAPTWRWPDKPRLGGCAAWPDTLMLAGRDAEGLITVSLNADGTPHSPPQLSEQRTWGRLAGMARASSETAVAGTVNKAAGGSPVSSDDRVVIIPRSSGGDAKD